MHEHDGHRSFTDSRSEAFYGSVANVSRGEEAAQNAPPPPPPPAPAAPEPAPPRSPLTEKQLENLVSRIALYPDPLLAQILTASTYGNEIPEAAAWANEHSNLKGEVLANAIREVNLQWDPSVLALTCFRRCLT